mmetsp:Transcript_23784/g.35717  ORF Transcript_23784/g.35717 Transcript_23784/m.35717 type:complete len:83 (-) Transcript_23784:759-1007(-)
MLSLIYHCAISVRKQPLSQHKKKISGNTKLRGCWNTTNNMSNMKELTNLLRTCQCSVQETNLFFVKFNGAMRSEKNGFDTAP